MKKCLGEHPTLPGKLADEENDPRHHHRPSFSPDVVSSVCFIFTDSSLIAQWGEEVVSLSVFKKKLLF